MGRQNERKPRKEAKRRAKREDNKKRREAQQVRKNKEAAEVRQARERIAGMWVAVERYRTIRAVAKHGSPVLVLLLLLIIVIIVLYGPQDRVELVSEILDKLGINKALYIIIALICALILGGQRFGRWLDDISSGNDIEV